MNNKKKVLLLTYTVPYPPTDGGKISIFGTVNYLRKHFNITLALKVQDRSDTKNIATLQTIWPDVSIKSLDQYQEEAPLILFIKRVLRTLLNISKTILHIRSKNTDRYDINFFPFVPAEKAYVQFIGNILAHEKFDIIQIEHSKLLNMVHIIPQGVKSIFVQIENRYAIIQDYFSIHNDTSLYSRYIIDNAKFTEFGLMNKYDHVFALSPKDKEEFAHYIPNQKIHVAPFPILDSLTAKESALDDFKPTKLVFLGSQGHLPNEDAVRWFIKEVYTEIRARTGLKLYVTGQWEKDIIKMNPEVTFTGFINDLSGFLQNCIVISPIRLGGGGIRAKVLQTMAMRVPMISSRLGCEGVEGLKHMENIMIADTRDAFISCIHDLIEKKELCIKIISNAFSLIKNNYSEEAVGKSRQNTYNTILREP